MFNPAGNNWHKCDVNVDKNDVLTIPYYFLMNVTVEKVFSCIVCNIKTFCGYLISIIIMLHVL